MTEEKVWHLGKALNGSKEGITRPKNKILAEFLNKNPSLPKRQVDRKAKDISSSLYLVHPDLFEEFVIIYPNNRAWTQVCS